jgi:hypothetical protein
MLGWHIGVFRTLDGGSEPARAQSQEGVRLAVWQTNARGLDWLEALVNAGRAMDLGGDGYPLRFTAQAQYLIPPIVAGPPEAYQNWITGLGDILKPDWEGKTVIDHAAVESCRPDEWLLVVAWDES